MLSASSPASGFTLFEGYALYKMGLVEVCLWGYDLLDVSRMGLRMLIPALSLIRRSNI